MSNRDAPQIAENAVSKSEFNDKTKKFENLKKRKGKPLPFGTKVKIQMKSRATTADANGFTEIEIESDIQSEIEEKRSYVLGEV